MGWLVGDFDCYPGAIKNFIQKHFNWETDETKYELVDYAYKNFRNVIAAMKLTNKKTGEESFEMTGLLLSLGGSGHNRTLGRKGVDAPDTFSVCPKKLMPHLAKCTRPTLVKYYQDSLKADEKKVKLKQNQIYVTDEPIRFSNDSEYSIFKFKKEPWQKRCTMFLGYDFRVKFKGGTSQRFRKQYIPIEERFVDTKVTDKFLWEAKSVEDGKVVAQIKADMELMGINSLPEELNAAAGTFEMMLQMTQDGKNLYYIFDADEFQKKHHGRKLEVLLREEYLDADLSDDEPELDEELGGQLYASSEGQLDLFGFAGSNPVQ